MITKLAKEASRHVIFDRFEYFKNQKTIEYYINMGVAIGYEMRMSEERKDFYNHNSKPVFAINVQTGIESEFPSIAATASHFKTDERNIRRHVRDKKVFLNCLFY